MNKPMLQQDNDSYNYDFEHLKPGTKVFILYDSSYVNLKQEVLFQHIRKKRYWLRLRLWLQFMGGEKIEFSQIMVLLVICCYITNHHKLSILKKHMLKITVSVNPRLGGVQFVASESHQAEIKVSARQISHFQNQLGKVHSQPHSNWQYLVIYDCRTEPLSSYRPHSAPQHVVFFISLQDNCLFPQRQQKSEKNSIKLESYVI